jgi:hypothetical protein
MPDVNILDSYVHTAPSVQNAIDIFKGEWISRFPATSGVQAGTIPLFEDGRLTWALNELGGVKGQSVLELGPLEAGHSYMLEQLGAASIVSVEANTRAFLKCLVVKEVLKLDRTKYLCGDFVEYLKTTQQKFDFVLASGVLYHMRNPVELLALLASHTDRVYLWTHYFSLPEIQKNPMVQHRFPSQTRSTVAGFSHTLHRFEYENALEHPVFCGGGEVYSNWLERADLLNCLSHLGFKKLTVGLEQIDHLHGPCIGIAASK